MSLCQTKVLYKIPENGALKGLGNTKSFMNFKANHKCISNIVYFKIKQYRCN